MNKELDVKVKKCNDPLVSIIVPICNVEPYLPKCLDSIVNQTLKNIEIICIDDCSRDRSAEILKEYAEKDKRIVPIFHEENLSTSQARKDGVAVSHGKYIMFVDGDDELFTKACETAYQAIEKYQTDMVQFDTEIVNCAGVPEDRIKMNQKLLKPYMKEIHDENLVFSCWEERKFGFSLWNKIFDGEICRRAFEKVKDGSFPKAQDLYAFFLIAYYSKTYMGIENPLYRYKFGLGVTGSNFISVEKFDILLTERKIWECLSEFIEEQNEANRYRNILEGIYQHFLGDCVNRWKNNLQIECLSEGFRHLVEVWGLQDVLCKLAAQNWYNSTAIAEKMAEVDYFTHIRREEKKRKTVAMYYRSIKNGGAQRVVAALCNLWVNMRDEDGNRLYDVVLITDEESDTDNLTTEYYLDSAVKRTYLPSFQQSIKEKYEKRYHAWERIIEEYLIDIVVTGMWVDPCTLWDMLSVKGQPSKPAFVIHCHSFLCVPYRFVGDKFAELIYDYHISDGVVTLSEVDERLASSFAKHSKYIFNPITFSLQKTEITKREKNTLVWIGRISSEKQPMDIVYMMEHVVKELPDAKLYLIGQGNEKIFNELTFLIERLGLQENIILVGFSPEVEKYYQLASVLVGTSEYEGFPTVFCEAMSHGVPIVSYDLPWLTLVRDGRGIITVEQKRSDLLAKKVIDLLNNPQKGERIGLEGRQQIEELEQTDIGQLWNEFFEKIGTNDPNEKNQDEVETILLKYMTVFAKIGKDLKVENLNNRIRQLTLDNKTKDNKIKSLEKQNKAIKNTITFKIGKLILFLPRKIYAFLKKR